MTAPSQERLEAIAAGKKTYFTGKPCSRGHIAERFVSIHTCVVCSRAHHKKFYADNPDSNKKSQKKYYHANKAQRAAYLLKWQKSEAGKTHIRKYNRDRKAHIKRATTKYGQGGVDYLYAMAQDLGLTVDHIVPLRHPRVSGLHNIFNLQLISLPKNMLKGNAFEGVRTHHWRPVGERCG